MLIWQKMLVVEAVSGSASFPDMEMQRLEGCQQLDVEKREVFIIRGILERETTKKSVFIIKKQFVQQNFVARFCHTWLFATHFRITMKCVYPPSCRSGLNTCNF